MKKHITKSSQNELPKVRGKTSKKHGSQVISMNVSRQLSIINNYLVQYPNDFDLISIKEKLILIDSELTDLETKILLTQECFVQLHNFDEKVRNKTKSFPPIAGSVLSGAVQGAVRYILGNFLGGSD
jgi:hypothetical protein